MLRSLTPNSRSTATVGVSALALLAQACGLTASGRCQAKAATRAMTVNDATRRSLRCMTTILQGAAMLTRRGLLRKFEKDLEARYRVHIEIDSLGELVCLPSRWRRWPS